MSDREALVAALENATIYDRRDNLVYQVGRAMATSQAIKRAARERLAQLPDECGTCGGRGFYPTGDQINCIVCHGSGKVYRAELVERIAEALSIRPSKALPREIAVLVLDALNGEAEVG